MKAKKILIVNNNLHIGGVQKALVNLLWCIHEKYDITLLLLSLTGEYLQDLPPDVKVITPVSAFRYLGMTKYDVKSLPEKLGRAFFAIITRIFGRNIAIALMGIKQKKIEGFDVAISYLHNSGSHVFYGGCNDFVLKHVRASKKVTFLHCDYIGCGGDTPENAKQYEKFDVIAACSKGCANVFLQACPNLKERVKVIKNCHRFDQICASASEAPVQLKKDKINIVTVARLGKEKGVERALRAIACLGEKKEKLHYYIVGDGIQKELLLQITEIENLTKYVTFCGELRNPYGYIAAADLLLIPSYSEAAPLVIGEAASLGTPILSMETSSAREMIEQCGFGWVCENSEEAMTEALRNLLSMPSRLVEAKSELEYVKFDNQVALNQFATWV